MRLESSTLKYAEVRAWLKAFDEGINSGKLLAAMDCEIMRMIVERIIVKDNGIEVCLKCGVSIGQEFVRQVTGCNGGETRARSPFFD